jgi:effector-binding domain-containing protein
MQIKSHPAMNVLYSSHQTILNTIHDKVGTVARELYAEAARQHLLVTGPVYWFYYGLDGNPQTVFTLEIAIPVSGQPYANGDYLFNELPAFKCIALTHTGSWANMKESYTKLMTEIAKQNLGMNGICREVYLNIDFSREDCNITEIQIGLQ